MTIAEALEGSGLPQAAVLMIEESARKLTAERRVALAHALDENLADTIEYAMGMLRTIAAGGMNSSPQQLAALAQAGIDLITLGPDGCAEMRGDADPRNQSQSGGPRS